MTHELKTWPSNYWPIFLNVKNFDVRVNDRDFKVGDKLKFREYDPKTEQYTGRVCFREISFVLGSNPHIKLKNKVILSFI